MDKPFMPIDEQVVILERRGLGVDTVTSRILAREGYYPVVNGYKVPFLKSKLFSAVITKQNMEKAGQFLRIAPAKFLEPNGLLVAGSGFEPETSGL